MILHGDNLVLARLFEDEDADAAVRLTEAKRHVGSDRSWTNLRITQEVPKREQIDHFIDLEPSESVALHEIASYLDIPSGCLQLSFGEELPVDFRNGWHDFGLAHDRDGRACGRPCGRVLMHHLHIEAQVPQLLKVTRLL